MDPQLAEEADGELSFAADRRILSERPEELSKFEKCGQRLTLLLQGELQKIEKGQKPETRLEDYQLNAVLAVKEHYSTTTPALSEHGEARINKMALIVAPPGSGKSGMVTLIPYVLQSKKVLVLTPSKIISEQLSADFGSPNLATSFFMKSGMYTEPRQLSPILETVHLALTQSDIHNIRVSNLVIVNAQKFGGRSATSLSNNSGRTQEQRDHVAGQLSRFDTIIVDEAHYYPAKTWKNILDFFEGKKVIFLTATPFRGNIPLKDLSPNIETVYEIENDKLEGKTIRHVDFIEKVAVSEDLEDLEFFIQLRKDIDEILANHFAQENRAPIHQAMILVRTKLEAALVAQNLGDDATFVISDKNADRCLQEFTAGRKKIVVVCGKLKEGYDNPKVSLVVILRKCGSRVLFEQFCGRCMRVNRSLTGKRIDKTVGIVLSYKHFNQQEMWDQRLKIPENHPVDEDEEENSVANIIL